MTIHIGITGTRKGWTDNQRAEVCMYLSKWEDVEPGRLFHHGDCVGVDAEAHEAATNLGYVTVSHPPQDSRLRAWCEADVTMPPKPYMDRNRDIVKAVSVLIVVPEGTEADHPRSGTWATYRMAVRTGVETVVIMP